MFSSWSQCFLNVFFSISHAVPFIVLPNGFQCFSPSFPHVSPCFPCFPVVFPCFPLFSRRCQGHLPSFGRGAGRGLLPRLRLGAERRCAARWEMDYGTVTAWIIYIYIYIICIHMYDMQYVYILIYTGCCERKKNHETIHSIKAIYPQNFVFLALTTPLSD